MIKVNVRSGECRKSIVLPDYRLGCPVGRSVTVFNAANVEQINMLILEGDSRLSNAHYVALTDDILIGGLTGPAPIALNFGKPVNEKRKYCRYLRNDIQASITESRVLFRRKFKLVRLVDISQFGVAIGCAKKLKCGQQLKLLLTFQDGQSFQFNGVVVHRRSGDENMIYGLKFDRSNRHFEEHLLKTGLKIKLNNVSMTE